jgi:hypothetical protein
MRIILSCLIVFAASILSACGGGRDSSQDTTTADPTDHPGTGNVPCEAGEVQANACTNEGLIGTHRTSAPDQQEYTELVHTISHWLAGFLEREGILERDEDSSYQCLEVCAEYPYNRYWAAWSATALPPGHEMDAAPEASVQHTPGHPLLMLRINSPC